MPTERPPYAPPSSEAELLERAARLAGKTLQQVALETGMAVPPDLLRAKGWVGTLMERYLGATAGSRPEEDFTAFGIELKTLPIGNNGRPRESTYICQVPLLPDPDCTWEKSLVKRKLARVLWLPVEGDPEIPVAARRCGTAFLWSPEDKQEQILRRDWEELMEKIVLGRLDQISARDGTYLQIRPKARHGRSLSAGTDDEGQLIQSLPRGFYLRVSFTRQVLATQMNGCY